MKTENLDIKIRGMICRTCTDEVTGELLRTNGVIKAKVSYRKALASVSYDPDIVTPQELDRRIKALGCDTGERSLGERLLDLGCAMLTLLLVWLLRLWGGASPEISGASFAAMLLVGLSTSPHCLGMCGGILLSVCDRADTRARLGADLAYNAARCMPRGCAPCRAGAQAPVLR